MFNTWIFSKMNRFFWKCVYRFFNRRSTIGRIINTRRVKRQMPNVHLHKSIRHAISIFEHFDPNINILFLGSSHTVYGIAPRHFKTLQALNAGFNSGDAKLAYYIYQTLRKQWPTAPRQAVVISDDFWTTSHQTELTPEFYQAVLVKYFTGMPYDSAFLTGAHDRFVASQINHIRDEGVSEEILCERGFVPDIPINSNANSSGEITHRVLAHVKRAFFKPTQLHYLSALKEAVEADGRQFIFLRFPVREDYLAVLDAYPKNVWEPSESVREGSTLIDLFRMPVAAEHWADTDHFSEAGARWFTQVIESDLLKCLN